jgi:hypothetical protein
MTPFTASAIGCAHNRERNYSTGAQHGITHSTVSTACLVGVCAVELQQLLSGEVASQSTVEPLAQIHAEIQIHKAAQFWSADPAGGEHTGCMRGLGFAAVFFRVGNMLRSSCTPQTPTAPTATVAAALLHEPMSWRQSVAITVQRASPLQDHVVSGQ